MPTPYYVDPDNNVNWFALNQPGVQSQSNLEQFPIEFGGYKYIAYLRQPISTGYPFRITVASRAASAPEGSAWTVLDFANSPACDAPFLSFKPSNQDALQFAFLDQNTDALSLVPFNLAAAGMGTFGTIITGGPVAFGMYSLNVKQDGTRIITYLDNHSPRRDAIVQYTSSWSSASIIGAQIDGLPEVLGAVLDSNDDLHGLWYLPRFNPTPQTISYFRYSGGSIVHNAAIFTMLLARSTTIPGNSVVGQAVGEYTAADDTAWFPFTVTPGTVFVAGTITPVNEFSLIKVTAASTLPSVGVEGIDNAPGGFVFRNGSFFSANAKYYAAALLWDTLTVRTEEKLLLYDRPTLAPPWSAGSVAWDNAVNPFNPGALEGGDLGPLVLHPVNSGTKAATLLSAVIEICGNTFYLEIDLAAPQAFVGIATMRNARRGISTPQGGIAA